MGFSHSSYLVPTLLEVFRVETFLFLAHDAGWLEWGIGVECGESEECDGGAHVQGILKVLAN